MATDCRSSFLWILQVTVNHRAALGDEEFPETKTLRRMGLQFFNVSQQLRFAR